MSESYSFENNLVVRDVLENILCIELHCHGERQVRNEILAAFENNYKSFLDITRPHNERIFYTRQLGINIKPLPKSIGKLANLSLTCVKPHHEDALSLIKLEREPTKEEIKNNSEKFAEVKPHSGYRGKFALMFFLRRIELLGKDRNADDSVFFKNIQKSPANANGQLSLESVAAKSLPPPAFRNFIEAITFPAEATVSRAKPATV